MRKVAPGGARFRTRIPHERGDVRMLARPALEVIADGAFIDGEHAGDLPLRVAVGVKAGDGGHPLVAAAAPRRLALVRPHDATALGWSACRSISDRVNMYGPRSPGPLNT